MLIEIAYTVSACRRTVNATATHSLLGTPNPGKTPLLPLAALS